MGRGVRIFLSPRRAEDFEPQRAQRAQRAQRLVVCLLNVVITDVDNCPQLSK